ncbi:hypothetical protein YC68_23575 [Vibrio parahaemolyticus]|nr:hypothetical protein YC68_23575 [Vibrio parahaemolyticus]
MFAYNFNDLEKHEMEGPEYLYVELHLKFAAIGRFAPSAAFSTNFNGSLRWRCNLPFVDKHEMEES